VRDAAGLDQPHAARQLHLNITNMSTSRVPVPFSGDPFTVDHLGPPTPFAAAGA
jgi:hypothetical protein